MPTIFTHTAVPLATGLGLGNGVVSRRLLVAGLAGSVLPDLDVVAFHLGIPYATAFGHRGFSHSILFALLIALLGASFFRWLRSSFGRSFAFLFLAVSSHGILDAFTNGGMGIAFLWPWSDTRYFAPVQPIAVSPIGLQRFLTERGLHVLESELVWVWLPCSVVFLFTLISRRLVRKYRAASV